MYAKVINGVLRQAPYKLNVGSQTVYDPSESLLAAHGYKQVQFTPEPATDRGYIAVTGWRDDGDSIVQTWTTIELPPDEEISNDEAFSIIVGV